VCVRACVRACERAWRVHVRVRVCACVCMHARARARVRVHACPPSSLWSPSSHGGSSKWQGHIVCRRQTIFQLAVWCSDDTSCGAQVHGPGTGSVMAPKCRRACEPAQPPLFSPPHIYTFPCVRRVTRSGQPKQCRLAGGVSLNQITLQFNSIQFLVH
jgi:hypothetical protein